jgi:hypothetical protein
LLDSQKRWFPARAVITADVGAGGIPPSAIVDAAKGRFHMHLHAGDIAYDMPVDHGATGDAWSNELQNISRTIPFQAWPGNHETDDNHCDFLNYRARFFTGLRIGLAPTLWGCPVSG